MTNPLFIHQFEPKIENFIIHKNIIQQLQKFISNGFIEMNIMLYGPRGAGKFSIVLGLMNHLFDDSAFKYTLKTTMLDKKEFQYENTKNFIIINTSNFSKTNRKLIVKFIQNLAQSKNILGNYHIVIIKNIDLLDKICQEKLLRIMEINIDVIRIIGISHSYNSMIPAFRSRFLIIRIPAPTKEEILSIFKIYKNINKYPYQRNKLERIVDKFGRNLWKCINAYQLSYLGSNKNYKKQINYIDMVVSNLISRAINPNISNLTELRQILYKMVGIHCSGSELLSTVIKLVLKKYKRDKTKDHIINKVIQSAAEYDHKSKLGDRELYHIEAFFIQLSQIFNNA